ncbi:MAG: hypothetical protein WCI62_01725 [Erysipelotrichaceae bacterium]
MVTVPLKNRVNRIIRFVETAPNGDKILKNANRAILGFYEKAHDVAKDKNRRIVGHCDILTSLLEEK